MKWDDISRKTTRDLEVLLCNWLFVALQSVLSGCESEYDDCMMPTYRGFKLRFKLFVCESKAV